MHIKLNWQQSLTIFSMVFGGLCLAVMIMTLNDMPVTVVAVFAAIIGVFAAFIGLAIWSRLRRIPKSIDVERRREEQRRILGEIGQGFLRVLFVVVLTLILERYARFRVQNRTFVFIPGSVLFFFALAPILSALSTDDE